ncbi:uncharacterized protein LOC124169730 [Ischnura elegans]|uniref:uncharacterized protein LOC124169730 n=1 Tax=Ischnura elegans TaxID=197161 RepID=UPI001ED867D6|nr:uncharacterized protein LOC124169730 [Ischnura elegans]
MGTWCLLPVSCLLIVIHGLMWCGEAAPGVSTLEFEAPEDEDLLSMEIYSRTKRGDKEAELSQQVRAILEHYKQDDPVGIPGAKVPDPMDIPDMKQSLSLGTMHFKNASVIGLSKFRIQHVHTDLAEMQLTVWLTLDTLDIVGLYTLSTFFSRTRGNFTTTLIDVSVTGHAQLEVDEEGHLQAQEIIMDITFDDINMDFENLGTLGSVFQSIVNSVGSFLFDSIKPFILAEVNSNIRGDINKQLLLLPQRFPNNIAPLDMAVAEGRRWVREQGWDPLRLPDRAFEYAGIRVEVTKAWATGASTFHRVGNATVTMEDNIISAGMHVGTKRIEGFCRWQFSALGLLTKPGRARFALDSLQVRMVVSQPLNVKKKAVLEELDIELGNIQVRMDGAGTLDYVVEYVVNVLPNMLRFQIVDALEEPLKQKAQEVLDTIDLEKIIEEKLNELESSDIVSTSASPSEEPPSPEAVSES